MVETMSLPLVAAQPGIWLADKLSAFDNAYTVTHYLELRGNLHIELLCTAIEQGLEETDTVQMTYNEIDGEVFQIVGGARPLPKPEVIDLQASSDPLQSCREFMEQDMQTNIRLDSGTPLVRHTILQVGNKEWIWYQRYHHVQLDAYSFTALTRRIVDIYSATKTGREQLTRPFLPFNGVAEEYQKYHESPKMGKDAAFWKELCGKLPDPASPSPIPLNGQQPSKKILRRSINLSPVDFRKVCDNIATSSGGTIGQSDVAIALISVWLLRLSNATEMGVGFIFMRRLGSAALNTAGPFINVLPMPIGIQDQDTLSTLAKDIARTLKLLRRHQKYDSEAIVRDSGRTWDDAPLYGPVINFKAFDYHLDFAEVQCTTHHLASGPIRDIELVLYINDEGELQVEYLANGERYDEHTLARNLDRLPLILKQFAENGEDLTCRNVNILLDEEENLISQVNNTDVEPSSETLVSLIHRQAELSSESVALQDANSKLTYAQMIEQVKVLAKKLKSQGVEPGDIVAVGLPRSALLSIALQAVVFAGATWLPLDRDYPADRLQLMIDDSNPRLVITDGDLEALETTENVIIFNQLFSAEEVTAIDSSVSLPAVQATQSAYIIYTSGSTGRPKGVLVSHRAVVNRLMWMQNEYKLQSDDTVLQKTPSSFDVSVWEFFWPLVIGAKLYMAPPEAHRDAEQLQDIILKQNVTTIHFVPSMLWTFMADPGIRHFATACPLRRTFCSGEALPLRLAKEWEQAIHVPLYNLYGPTEAAIDVTAYPAFGDHLVSAATSVPIGFPMSNNKLHVLDENMQPLPVGIQGDLYISGIQLAEGYLNQPTMTAKSFIFVNGVRFYRTGDLASWLPNGALEFHGRSDSQVKLRGQRLELGEIDSALTDIFEVSEAVTQARVFNGSSSNDADARQLVSYVVPTAGCELDVGSIRTQLAQRLPPYMVPAKLIVLEALPIGVTGKLNTRALPLPDVQVNSHAHRPVQNYLEKVVAESFKELLGYEGEVFAEDDFFSLGGHSLLAVRLAATLRKKLDLPVTIGQIMQAPRVESLAAQLSDESNMGSWQTAGFERILELRPGGKRNIFCIHPASGFSWQFSVLRRYLDPYWSLVGIQADGILGSADHLKDVVENEFKTIVEYSDGPYYLLGYSLGGTLAHALAARLEAAGKTVAFLGLLDTWPPETQNWDEKLGKNIVDQAVIDEMQKERQQFIAAQQGAFQDGGSTQLFDTIEQNYASAVRLLATARSSNFRGTTTLFVAERTFPEGTNLQEVWKPWTSKLVTIPVDSSHVDIISPNSFATLGPQINRLLDEFK